MHWLGDNPWAAWLAVAAALGVAELASMDFVLIMLAVGALGGLVVALVTDQIVFQLIAALVVSFALLSLARPQILRRLHSGPDLVLGAAKLIGAEAITPVELSASHPGQLKIDGELWTAQPYDSTLVIHPGERVEVLQIRGATAYVHPIPTLEER